MTTKSSCAVHLIARLREGDTPTIEDPWNEIAVLLAEDFDLTLLGISDDDYLELRPKVARV